MIDGYPASSDVSGSTVDADAARAEQEQAYARHVGEPWYDDAVRALAEVDDQQRDEETWISQFEPAWPMYFANPSSNLDALHLARIRAEVRSMRATANRP